MTTLLPFIVVGLTTGSVYALAAIGLVVTYKTSAVFNFGHGALAVVGAAVFYELHVLHGVPWPIALGIGTAVTGVVCGLSLELLARRLATASSAMRIVATIGLALAIQGMAVARYGAATRNFPTFLPQQTVRTLGVNIGVDQMIMIAAAVVIAGLLAAFFQRSRLGTAMRAVVDDPDLLALTGTSPSSVRRSAWIIGSTLAAGSGILLAPYVGLDALLLTLLVVQAFGAAAVGRFSSLPLAYAGGLAIGVASALATRYVGQISWLGGLPASLPFFVLFIVLLVTPPRRGTEAPRRMRAPRAMSPRVAAARRPAVAIAGVLLMLVPHVVGTRLPVYSHALVYVLLFLSLSLLVRLSGQVSLCHAAFAAVGATTFSHLATGAGAPWLLAVLGAGLVTVPVGALVALPAIRLSGLHLALATLGFGILLERMMYGTGLMFGFGGGGRLVTPRPGVALLASDTGYYYLLLGFVALGAAAVIALRATRLGRLLRALAESPTALATQGTNVNLTRLLVFCIAAFLAGVAGALSGPLTGSINSAGFTSFESLLLLAVLAISGAGEIRASFVAAASLAIVPAYIDNPTFVTWLPVLFGVAAIAAAVRSSEGRIGGRSGGASGQERLARSPVRERLVAAPVSA